MQPTQRPTAVVDAAAAMLERSTKEPTEEPRAGSVGDAELTAATACHFPGTFTCVPAIAFATAERSVGPYHVDVYVDQIVLHGSSHSSLGFMFRKEARAGGMRDR